MALPQCGNVVIKGILGYRSMGRMLPEVEAKESIVSSRPELPKFDRTSQRLGENVGFLEQTTLRANDQHLSIRLLGEP